MRSRLSAVVMVVATGLAVTALSACSTQASPAAPSPANATPESPPVKGMSVAAQKQGLLDAVCPTDSALQVLDASVVAAGGWAELSQADIRRFADAIIEAVESAARDLDVGGWDESIAADIAKTRDEYLAMLGAATDLREAASSVDRRSAWERLSATPRVGEESARLRLDLPRVDAPDDGCPPAPKVPAVKPTKKPSSPDASVAWTRHWTSPSGTIDCGYNPKSGVAGVAMIACVTESGYYASLVVNADAFPQFRPATREDYEALSVGGAERLEYNNWLYGDGYRCWQSPASGPNAIGMTCGPAYPGEGFSIYSKGTSVRYFR